MALDHVGLFTVLGKHIKAINLQNGYISAIETSKEEIRDAYEVEDLHDVYSSLPSRISQIQSSITSSIQNLISQCTTLLTDRDYVLEELPIFSYDINSVLDGLREYMVNNSLTIKTSVVSLGGADTPFNISRDTVSSATGALGTDRPRLMCGRLLDGTNNPSSSIRAKSYYSNLESMSAMTTTVRAEIVSNPTLANTTARLFADTQTTLSYQLQAESPGSGPNLSNIDSSPNLVGTNYDFTAWTGDNPTGWTMSGGVAGTDWEDLSNTGDGPLKLNTLNVETKRQITGLVHNRCYCIAILVKGVAYNATDDLMTVGLRLVDASGATSHMSQASGIIDQGAATYQIVYKFFVLPSTVDLDDVYVEVEYIARTHASDDVSIDKVVIAPATYYNGLAWAWWAPAAGTNNANIPLKAQQSLAVSNNNGGVIQTFFRKAYGVQLPAADSPILADSLAT